MSAFPLKTDNETELFHFRRLFDEQSGDAIIKWQSAFDEARERKNSVRCRELLQILERCHTLSSYEKAIFYASQGIFSQIRKEWQSAIGFYNRALRLLYAENELSKAGHVLSNLGFVYLKQHHPEQAIPVLQTALKTLKAIDDREQVAMTLKHLACSYDALDNSVMTLQWAKEALTVFKELGQQTAIQQMMQMIASVLCDMNKMEKALSYYQIILDICYAREDYLQAGHTLHQIGKIHSHLKSDKQAAMYLRRALSIFRVEGVRLPQHQILYNLAELCRQQSNTVDALAFYEQALQVCQALELSAEEAHLLARMADVCGRVRGIEAALTCYRRALARYRTLQDDDNYHRVGRDLCAYAIIHLRHGRADFYLRTINILDEYRVYAEQTSRDADVRQLRRLRDRICVYAR